jgi:hypothetical protein
MINANSRNIRAEQTRTVMAAKNSMPIRLAAIAMALSGILFVLYPTLRPFSDEVSLQGARAFASSNWILAHVFAILGFMLAALGLLGLFIAFQESKVGRLTLWGLVISWIGVCLTLPFYGAEVFGLHAIGQEAVRQQSPALLELANQIRFGSGFIMIVTGLLLLGIGAVLIAVAIWKSGSTPKWSGIPFALGFLLYIPQYAASQPVRVMHGILLAAGCIWISAGLWQLQISSEQSQ